MRGADTLWRVLTHAQEIGMNTPEKGQVCYFGVDYQSGTVSRSGPSNDPLHDACDAIHGHLGAVGDAFGGVHHRTFRGVGFDCHFIGLTISST